MEMKPFVDAEMRPLTVGQRVEIRHCVGRYGETRTIQGVIQAFNALGGVTVSLESEHFTDYGRHGSTRYRRGDSFYVCNAFEWSPVLEAWHGHRVHDDFEHGHTAYCRII